MSRSRTVSLAAGIAWAAGCSVALAGAPSDWSAIPAHTVTLFYPGQSGYDWLRSPAHRRADAKVRAGDSCVSCHEGEEAEIGALIVTGEKLEPAPLDGKKGSVELQVQAAYDDQNLYLRFQWPTQLDRPGQMHSYMRYDGEAWAFYGEARSEEEVRSGEQPPLYEDRLTIMLDDGGVPLFAEQGCWLTCHSGMRDMPDEPSSDAVKAHPLLGEQLKVSEVQKYLPGSRTDEGASWDQTKPAEEIAALKAEGHFVDLMQWRAHRSNAVNMADDGYVLEYRLSDAGKGPFTWNVDRSTMTPKFMFDEAKVGVKSLTVDDIGDPAKPFAMIREENAIAYDPDAGWQEGDVLPGRLLSREDAEGSAADNRDVHGIWENGIWTVTWARPLDTGHPEDDKILREGATYNVGLAVHDDNVTTRFHFVSFPFTLGIGAKADIEAVRAE